LQINPPSNAILIILQRPPGSTMRYNLPNKARLPPPGVPAIPASCRMLRDLGLRVASSVLPFSIDNGDLNRKRKLGDESTLAVSFAAAAGTGVFDGVA
jgi:hypothetical protein